MYVCIYIYIYLVGWLAAYQRKQHQYSENRPEERARKRQVVKGLHPGQRREGADNYAHRGEESHEDELRHRL